GIDRNAAAFRHRNDELISAKLVGIRSPWKKIDDVDRDECERGEDGDEGAIRRAAGRHLLHRNAILRKTAVNRPEQHRSRKIIVVMPAYNAERTLERTLADVPRGWADEVLLVDDASRDGTADLAARLGLNVVRHERNTGYGGNQKTCYREALG